ncbi:MAG: hypothetical protein ABSF00_04210 [Candidatus Bathyarchaeia archaeon]|jgi:hypothetical protein
MASSNGTKKRLEQFQKIPEIEIWEAKFKGEKSTFNLYSKYFMQYLGTQAPAEFLQQCKDNPEKAGSDIDDKLSVLWKRSTSKANQTAYAILSFLKKHKIKNITIDLDELNVKEKRRKAYLNFDDSEKIIIETDEPYRTLYRVMRISGMGADEIEELNTNSELIENIKEQWNNTKDYIRIDLKPRKSGTTVFYTLIPKSLFPKTLPLLTHIVGGLDRKGKPTNKQQRGGTPITAYDLRENFRRGAKKAKLWYAGLGCHVLVSTFESTAGLAKVDSGTIEYVRGHSVGGDKFGYRREYYEETNVYNELKKLWSYTAPPTKKDVETLEQKYRALEEVVIPRLEEEKRQWQAKYQELQEKAIKAGISRPDTVGMAGFEESEEMKRIRLKIEAIDKQLKALNR